MWWRKRRERTLALNDMWKERRMIVILLGIICIPLLYSGIYLSAFFDPYGEMENLSVAVVNEDEGVSYKEKNVNVGKELVDRLKEDDQFGWTFVDREEMEKGVKKGKYRLAVLIPKDFSERAISVKDPEPLKGEIKYYANEGSSYLTSQIGKRMIQGLQDSIEENMIHAYAEVLFDKMDQSVAQLIKAKDGSSKLAGATGKAEEKTGLMENGATKLTAGAKKVANGLGQMHSQIQSSNKDLPKLRNGAEKVQEGIGTFNQLIHNPKLDRGVAVVSEKARQLKEDISQLKKIVQDLNAKNNEALQSYEQVLKNNPELADDPQAMRVKEILNEEQSNHSDLKERVERILGKAETVLDRASRLEQDLNKIQNSFDQLYNGQSQVVAGIKKVEAGMNQLEDATGKLYSGASLVATKLDQLSSGLDRLASALNQISDGQSTLTEKLADGVDEAREALNGKENKADQMSNPVEVDEDKLNEVPNYATGFAPYFISLSLWVGAMLLFTVLDMKRPLLDDYRPYSGLSVALIGVIQGLLLVWMLLHVVGIEAKETLWLYAFTVLIAVVFISINHFLVAAFKDPGRFLSILTLMFQLTSSSGTYPVELLPSFFQGVSPFLPMTYSIEGLRAVISTGDLSVMMEQAKILIGFGVGAWLLKLLAEWMWRELPQRLKQRKLKTAEQQ
ncbi:putative membrane protein [Melghirimyces algeriensis]|uniref:Putative membrane protein n=2 Tax=Melghirimyces algeriensis TaxID=910412 RepID=A0A521FBN0_9BACL|nr:putative membrane protein [Melghirimyces algeriensis]